MCRSRIRIYFLIRCWIRKIFYTYPTGRATVAALGGHSRETAVRRGAAPTFKLRSGDISDGSVFDYAPTASAVDTAVSTAHAPAPVRYGAGFDPWIRLPRRRRLVRVAGYPLSGLASRDAGQRAGCIVIAPFP